jgi:hypothetical protein
MTFENANLGDLLGCERRHLVTLESHSIDHEEKRNLSHVGSDRGCKGAACRLG